MRHRFLRVRKRPLRFPAGQNLGWIGFLVENSCTAKYSENTVKVDKR
jgi:hypothetical protein